MGMLTRRHAVVFFVILLSLTIWITHDRMPSSVREKLEKMPELPDMPDLPDFKGRLPKYLRPDDNLNGTQERYWTNKDNVLSSVADWERPLEVQKIMGLVFYGRRVSVSILDCYLKRNLVKNGGSLDGVIFIERTTDAQDVDFLNRMLESEPAYEKWEIDMSGKDNFESGFGISYDRIEDDVLYVKIDDDIVFMEDSVIPSLIHTKLSKPELYVVSANVVNQPLLSWVHWNFGAVKPYLPEVDDHGKPLIASRNITGVDWHVSSLPAWKGPDSFDATTWEPSEEGLHRWLPVRGKADHILDNTPIEQTEYDAYGRGWTLWQIGAQEHYSFLDNLERNELWQYKFGTWDFQFQRMGIQFIAIMGRDINAAKPIPSDDEDHFSCTMTKQLGRHAVADGRGVAAHYSFGSQRGGMKWADILERYRTFAKENICASPMLWSPTEEDNP